MNRADLDLDSKHLRLTGSTQAARRMQLQKLSLPPLLLPPISAHTNLRGPYTAAGSILRALVPAVQAANPTLPLRHHVELLTVAPELENVLDAATVTLTSLAVPDERTRFYSSLRTKRLSHGIVEFIQKYLNTADGDRRVLFIDDVQWADFTDLEFLAILLRRIPPEQLLVVIGSTAKPDYTAGSPSILHDRWIATGIEEALDVYCNQLHAADAPANPILAESGDYAQLYIDSDGTTDEPELISAYIGLAHEDRKRRHSERADQLIAAGDRSLTLGCIPYHLSLGLDPLGSGAEALEAAMDDCMRLGFYDATIAFCYQGRDLFDAERDFTAWWKFTTKLPTSLSAIGKGDAAEEICDEVRALTSEPIVHLQLAYATAMLYTRHLDPSRRDHDTATGWINQAIAISSLLPDRKLSVFNVVFNKNGLALIQAHRGRPYEALNLVTAGLRTLDNELGPNEHKLHRSVLRYNRAQVLASLKRFSEALEDYEAVIALDPNYPEYHFDRGNLLHKLGRDEEALSEYDLASELGPPFVELFYNKADLLASNNYIEDAIPLFSYVLELQPDYIDAYINRAGLLADIGQWSACAADVEHGLRYDDKNPHLIALRGRMELEEGQIDTARVSLDLSLSIDPAIASTWAVRGSLNYAAEYFERALADFDQAIELSPATPEVSVIYNRAMAAQALGRWAEADRGYSQVIDLEPEDSDAWLARSQVRAALGDADAASADEEKSRALSG